MTYSVWAYPKSLIQTKGEELKKTHELLIEARNMALTHMDEVVHTCVEMLGATAEFWYDYFGQFRYTFNLQLQEGLSRYFEYCVKYGQLPEQPELMIWPDDFSPRG